MGVEVVPLSLEEPAGEGPHRGKGPRGWRRDDARLRELICEHLTEDPWLDPSDVEVDVEDAIVHLRGSVRSQLEKRRAEDIAYSVRGVWDVLNELKVPQVFEGGEEHLGPTTADDQGPDR